MADEESGSRIECQRVTMHLRRAQDKSKCISKTKTVN